MEKDGGRSLTGEALLIAASFLGLAIGGLRGMDVGGSLISSFDSRSVDLGGSSISPFDSRTMYVGGSSISSFDSRNIDLGCSSITSFGLDSLTSLGVSTEEDLWDRFMFPEIFTSFSSMDEWSEFVLGSRWDL